MEYSTPQVELVGTMTEEAHALVVEAWADPAGLSSVNKFRSEVYLPSSWGR